MATALALVGYLGWTLLDGDSSRHGGARGRGAEAPPEELPPPAVEEGGRGGDAGDEAGGEDPVGLEQRRLSGRVTDTAGRPIPGALVAVADGGPRTATARDGSFALRVAPRVHYVEALSPGYLPAGKSLDLRADRSYDFRLEEAASLSGTVADAASGAPVAGAVVYAISAERAFLDDPSRANTAVSGEDGRYVFYGLPAGTTDLGVRKPGYLPLVVEDVVVPAGGEHERAFRIERGRRIDVSVKNADERTVVFVSHPGLRDEHLPPGGLPALADALIGRSLVDVPVTRVAPDGPAHVPPGPIDAEARSPLKITEPGLGSVRDHTGPRLELELLDARVVVLEVVDGATGEALAPAILRESSGSVERFSVERSPSDGATRVPADGRQHTLHLALDGYQPASVALRPDQDEYEARMQPLAEGATGAFRLEFTPPLETGRVAVVGRDADGRRRWVEHVERPDEEGRWRVADVPVGEWTVSVLATGMVPVTLRVHVARGFEATHRVALTRGGGLRLEVVDPDGELLDKVGLLLRDESGTKIDLHVHSRLGGNRSFVSVNYLPVAATITADNGLAPGAYTILAGREGYRQARATFVVRGTEVTPVELTLAPQAAGDRRSPPR